MAYGLCLEFSQLEIRKFVELVAEGDNLDEVKKLFESGILTNYTKITTVHPLLRVTSLIVSGKYGRYSIIKYLVEEREADVNQADLIGRTVLMEASMAGHLNLVQYLYVCGARVDDVDEEGVSALEFAAFRDHVNVVKFLIGVGAKVRFKNKHYLIDDSFIRDMLQNVSETKTGYQRELLRKLKEIEVKRKEEKLKANVEVNKLKGILEKKEIEWNIKFITQEDEFKRRLKEQSETSENGRTKLEQKLKQEKSNMEIKIFKFKEVIEGNEYERKRKLKAKEEEIKNINKRWKDRLEVQEIEHKRKLKDQEDEWRERLKTEKKKTEKREKELKERFNAQERKLKKIRKYHKEKTDKTNQKKLKLEMENKRLRESIKKKENAWKKTSKAKETEIENKDKKWKGRLETQERLLKEKETDWKTTLKSLLDDKENLRKEIEHNKVQELLRLEMEYKSLKQTPKEEASKAKEIKKTERDLKVIVEAQQSELEEILKAQENEWKKRSEHLKGLVEKLRKEKLTAEYEICQLKEIIKDIENARMKSLKDSEEQLRIKDREWKKMFEAHEDEWKERLKKQEDKDEESKEKCKNYNFKNITDNKRKETEKKNGNWKDKLKAKEEMFSKQLKEKQENKEKTMERKLNSYEVSKTKHVNREGNDIERSNVREEKIENKEEEWKGNRRKDEDKDGKRVSKELLELMDFCDIEDIYYEEEDQFKKRAEIKRNERKVMVSNLKRIEDKLVKNKKIINANFEGLAVLNKKCTDVGSVVEEDRKRVAILRRELDCFERDIIEFEADKRKRLTLLQLAMEQKKEGEEEVADGREKERKPGATSDDFRRRFEPIIDEIKALSDCQVCMESNKAKKLQCKNAHLTCVDCLGKMMNKKCPFCREEVKFEARNVNKIYERILLT